MNCVNCNHPMMHLGLFYKCAACLNFHKPCHTLTGFSPDKELGMSYKYNEKYEGITDDEVAWLISEAERALPPRTYFEIRASIPINYGNDKQLAWYYHPVMRTVAYTKWMGRLSQLTSNGVAFVVGGFLTQSSITTYAFKTISSILPMNTALDPHTGMIDCDRCKHSWYDHIGWRSAQDSKTNCRVVRCECDNYINYI